MNIVAIIQARVGSKRLPGKILKKIDGIPMIIKQLKRISYSKTLNQIIIAAPKSKKNDKLISLIKKNKFNFYRGSETNVLKRYYFAAKEFKADAIVRITSDNPLVPPELIDKFVKKFKNNKFDYVSNVLPLTYPMGCGVEIISFEALEKAYKKSKINYYKEHVTPYIHKNRRKFKIYNFKLKKDLSNFRLTVDEIDDFKVIKDIFSIFRPSINFSFSKIVKLFKKKPEIFLKNINIKQKNSN